jgi:hypothetical protein
MKVIVTPREISRSTDVSGVTLVRSLGISLLNLGLSLSF